MKTDFAASFAVSLTVLIMLFQFDLPRLSYGSLLLYLLLLLGGVAALTLCRKLVYLGRLLLFIQLAGLIGLALFLKVPSSFWILPGTAAAVLAAHYADIAEKREPLLSREQQEIIYLIVEKRMTNKAAAYAMGLDAGSLGRKVSEIYRRLGLDSRSSLTAWYDAHPLQRLIIRRKVERAGLVRESQPK